MAGIGFIVICEDVAYEDEIFYIKNPYDAVVLDKLPTEEFSFHMLVSLYSLEDGETYPLLFTYYDPDMNEISKIKFPLRYESNPPKGKESTGALTLNIKSKNLKFTNEGLYKICVELTDNINNCTNKKELVFPVFLKSGKGENSIE